MVLVSTRFLFVDVHGGGGHHSDIVVSGALGELLGHILHLLLRCRLPFFVGGICLVAPLPVVRLSLAPSESGDVAFL